MKTCPNWPNISLKCFVVSLYIFESHASLEYTIYVFFLHNFRKVLCVVVFFLALLFARKRRQFEKSPLSVYVVHESALL